MLNEYVIYGTDNGQTWWVKLAYCKNDNNSSSLVHQVIYDYLPSAKMAAKFAKDTELALGISL